MALTLDFQNSAMECALTQARAARARGEVPVGAAIFSEGGTQIAADGNRILELKDPTAHAESLVIRRAAAVLGNERLIGCVLAVTLEPCAMCAGAIALARVRTLIFGAIDPKGGAVISGPRLFEQPTINHRPQTVGPIGPPECGIILKEFFARRRNLFGVPSPRPV